MINKNIENLTKLYTFTQESLKTTGSVFADLIWLVWVKGLMFNFKMFLFEMIKVCSEIKRRI